MKKAMEDNIVQNILIHFYENEPQSFLTLDQIEIDGLDKSTILRYIPLLFEANYLQGYYIAIDAYSGKYLIGGLLPVAKEAIRQHKLGRDIDIHNAYW